jgi:tetratricopeptide (TPR) repeat protein
VNSRARSTRTALARVLLGACVCIAGTALHCGTASAQNEPSVDEVRAAGEAFNEGRTAFKAAEYSTAAEHFEKADQLAPNPKVLLLAIQSREQAGQFARAATLAALAQDRYPEDQSFAESRTLIERALGELGKLKVSCDAPCSLMIDSRLVHGDAATKRFLFLEPGSYKIRAAWQSGGSQSLDFVAVAGESGKLDFVRSGSDAAAVAAADTDWAETPDAKGDDLPKPKTTYDDLSQPNPSVRDDGPKGDGGLSPTVFWVSGGVTLALAAASTGMGIYTQNNPGKKAIQEQCDGLGESCPAWKEGKSNEQITNVLWGVTAGAGIATILIGAIWTDWGPTTVDVSSTDGDSHTDLARGERTSTAFSLEPWFAVGDGAALGARGRF